MASSTFHKFNCFARDVACKVHNLSTDAFKFRLTNAAPTATMDILSCITTIATGNGWSTDAALTIAEATLDGSTWRLELSDATVEAAGGEIGPFRYVVVFNDTPAAPTDPLIGYLDYTTNITLGAGEKLVIDFQGAGTGVIKIS